MTNYTKHATIKPVVLSSSAYRHYGAPVFPEGRRVGLTLVTSPDFFQPVFKLGGKTPLFVATPNADATVTLTSTNVDFPSHLTIAGADLVRLTDKVGMLADEPFMTLGDHLAYHWEPTDQPTVNVFTPPTLDDCADFADFADFADAHLGSYYAPVTAVEEEKLTEADELANYFLSLPTTPEVKPAPALADADELAEALSPTKPAPAPVTPSPAPTSAPTASPPRRRKLSEKYRKRITRKSSGYRGRYPTPRTDNQFKQDVSLLWG